MSANELAKFDTLAEHAKRLLSRGTPCDRIGIWQGNQMGASIKRWGDDIIAGCEAEMKEAAGEGL